MSESVFKTFPITLGIICICCISCKQRDIHDYSAVEHFSEAQACKINEEDLSLAIWHYEQALSDETLDEATAAVAKIELNNCHEEYIRQSGCISATGAKNQDLEMQLRLLKQRNNELESWISRLNTENLTLRQSLSKIQGESH